MIKGINPEQSILMLPSHKPDTIAEGIPAIIGSLTARTMKASVGDHIMLRWRDSNGTFDSVDIVLTDIFSVNVPAVEAGQIYVPLEKLREVLMMPDGATILTFREGIKEVPDIVCLQGL